MPFINLATSEKIDEKKLFLKELVKLISSLTNKSERFVMIKLEDKSEMYFGDERPCCFLEIKSIGSLNPSEMAKPICDFVYEKIGINQEKIYICFEDVPASTWGWNSRTFG